MDDDRVRPAAEELAFDGLPWMVRAGLLVRRVTRRPDPIKVIQHRERVRDMMYARLAKPGRDHWPEVIVVQASKASRYPEIKDKIFDFGPPDWMKVEVSRITDDALEVGLQFVRVRIRNGQARPVDHLSDQQGRKVLIVGRLPYEKIAHVDWSGDPAYSSPRLYMHFRWRSPYKAIEVHSGGDGQYFAMQGVTFKDTRYSHLDRIRFNLESRRNRLGREPSDFDDP
jgi:hypothetical protein